ncbi:MAG: hypothetical protein EOO24_27605, partial [Comamonadaceae bacterium]
MTRSPASAVLAGASLFVCGAALAQTTGGSTLSEVTVTGNPLGSAEVAAPVSSTGGTDLLLLPALVL